MTFSLTVAGFELLDPDNNPYLLADGDPIFTATLGIGVAGTHNDLGSPLAELTSVPRLLDGDVVSGAYSRNRQITLTVNVLGATPQARAAAMSALCAAVDQPTFTTVWTPNGGLPVALDCYRAQVHVVFSPRLEMYASMSRVELVFEALPYARTPTPVTLGAAATSPVTLDALTNTTGLTVTFTGSGGTYSGTTAAADTTTFVRSPSSVSVVQQFTYTGSGGTPALGNGTPYVLSWSRAVTSLDTSALAVAAVQAFAPGAGYGTIGSPAWAITLSSSGGKSSTWAGSSFVPSDRFGQVSFDLTATPTATTSGGVVRTAVTGWQISFTFTELYYDADGYRRGATGYAEEVWLNLLTLLPASSGMTSAPAGVVHYPTVLGARRAPAGLMVNALGSGANRLIVARSPARPPGFSPLLGTPTSSSSSSTDSATLRGSYDVNPSYTLPAQAYTGTFVLLARLSLLTAGKAIIATVAGQGTAAQVTSHTLTAAEAAAVTSGSYGIIPVGVITLPGQQVAGQNTAGTFTLAISTTAGTAAFVDQLYLIDVEGSVTYLSLPPGTAYSYFFIDPPSVTSTGTGQVFGGSRSDRTDAVDLRAWLKSPTVHEIDPGPNDVLVVADGATSANLTITYSPLWFLERPV